jgi:AraC-like DNA-binding protein
MTAEFEPTADQRALVENAAAFGLTQADIANQLNIDEKTLRKHFREALNSGKFKVDMLAGREAQSPPRAADVLGYPFETLHGQRREKSRPRLHRADEAGGAARGDRQRHRLPRFRRGVLHHRTSTFR